MHNIFLTPSLSLACPFLLPSNKNGDAAFDLCIPMYELILTFLLFRRCILQLLQGSTELVGTRGALLTTADAIDAGDDIVDLLTTNQLADALQVAMTATQEEDLLDDVVLVGSHVDEFRTGAFCLVLYVLCFHKSDLFCLIR